MRSGGSLDDSTKNAAYPMTDPATITVTTVTRKLPSLQHDMLLLE